jgi:NADPH-dependent 2,4-dienoyl-CoA reductase/sulfur reductase-like enzyme/rhodanese-related sulfurtransferase
MSRRIVIVGAVAAGPKVAARLKRCEPDAEITVFSRERFISYGGCGIPYYIGGDVDDEIQLRSTTYHMERNEEFFRNIKHFDVRTGIEVTRIDRSAKSVFHRNLDTGEEGRTEYDVLVLATGSRPVLPPLRGSDLPGVYTIAGLQEAVRIKETLTTGQLHQAVVVGAGAIGLEMAEAFTDLWGVETTLVEMQDRVLPATLGSEMSRMVAKHLRDNDVSVLTSTRVTGLEGDRENGVRAVQTSQGRIPCQLALFSVGARPNAALAADAGLSLGPNGGILVDERMRTSDPSIYAGGDCVEQKHLIGGNYVHLPLGSLANRHGRVIGTNIAGGAERFRGVVGSFCLKVFEYGIARAGLTVEQARESGFDPVYSLTVQPDRAHFYPGSELMFLQIAADRRTRRILGIEGLGRNMDAVKARVDAIAAAMSHGADASEISNLEVSYSPPFSSAMDIANTCANVLLNVLDGLNRPADPEEFVRRFEQEGARVLDVRDPEASAGLRRRYGDRWINIPMSSVPDRLDELPREEPLYVFCNTGTTAFEVQRYLNARGLDQARTVSGSFALLRELAPDMFAPGPADAEGQEP